jgi:hypothetical protein
MMTKIQLSYVLIGHGSNSVERVESTAVKRFPTFHIPQRGDIIAQPTLLRVVDVPAPLNLSALIVLLLYLGYTVVEIFAQILDIRVSYSRVVRVVCDLG